MRTFEIRGESGYVFDVVNANDADDALDAWALAEFGEPYDEAIVSHTRGAMAHEVTS